MRPLLLAAILLSGCKTVVVNCSAPVVQPTVRHEAWTTTPGLIVTPNYILPGATNADCKPGQCDGGNLIFTPNGTLDLKQWGPR